MVTLPRIKPLAKGILSFLIPGLRTVHSYGNPLGTLSAESCYSIFLRHLVLLKNAGAHAIPKVVAELGPGSSLGTGFCALIAGAEKYYALDVRNYSSTERNLAIFDKIVELFKSRSPIPSNRVHSLRFPDIDCYDFPDFLPAESSAAFAERIAAIRADIAGRTGNFVQVSAPWTEDANIAHNSVDWVFSQSVLEHIDDLDTVYRALAQWVKPSGYTSHLIDFGSHGLTQEWNGHWAVNELAWSALRGRRPYLINRLPYSEHLRLAAENGFRTVFEKRNKRFDGLIADQFAPSFRRVSDEDARTRMVLLVSKLAA